MLTLKLCAVGIEAESERVDALFSELEGKDITEVVAQGLSKLASVPSGGGGVAAPSGGGGGGAAAGGGAAEKKEEAKKEEEPEEEEDEVRIDQLCVRRTSTCINVGVARVRAGHGNFAAKSITPAGRPHSHLPAARLLLISLLQHHPDLSSRPAQIHCSTL